MNRRETLHLLAASGAAMSLPVPALGHTPPPLAAQLSDWLSHTALPFSPAQLQLVSLEQDGAQISVIVELHWAAGVRRRKFASQHPIPDTALAQIYTDIVRIFETAAGAQTRV